MKLSITWKTFLAHTSNFNVETLQQLEEFFFHTLSQTTTLKPLNNSKNYFSYKLSQTATLKPLNNLKNFFFRTLFQIATLKPLNNLKNFFFHTLSQTTTLKPLNNSKNPLSHTLNLNLKLKDLKNTLPHLKTYNILKKSFPHRKLQVPCMPPFGNQLPFTLQTKKPLSKGFSPFSMQYKLKILHYFLF